MKLMGKTGENEERKTDDLKIFVMEIVKARREKYLKTVTEKERAFPLTNRITAMKRVKMRRMQEEKEERKLYDYPSITVIH